MKLTKKRQILHFCIVILCISFCFVVNSCSFNENMLRQGMWKYCEGFYLNDVISFENYELINDTLYLDKAPKAILLSKEESIFGFTDRKIILRAINSTQTGTYCQK